MTEKGAKKYPCTDCNFCQWCDDNRCRKCRPRCKAPEKMKTPDKLPVQNLAYDKSIQK